MAQREEGTLKSISTTYLWEIRNFIVDLANLNPNWISPVVTVSQSNQAYAWHMVLCPSGIMDEDKDCLSLYLQGTNLTDFALEVTFSLLDSKNNRSFGRTTNEVTEGSLGFHRFIERGSVTGQEDLLEGDKLRILCEIVFNKASYARTTGEKRARKERNIERGKSALLPYENVDQNSCRLTEFDDFENLLNSELYSDVVFLIDNREIRLHKAILTSRSNVFRDFFERRENNGEETTGKCEIQILHIQYEVLYEFLRFLYSGKTSQLNKIAGELLPVAERCSMKTLKILCEKSLYANLRPDNALRYLELAVISKANQLRSQIIKYIARHLKDVIEQAQFGLFAEKYADVTCELVCALAMNDSAN